jgi:GNAT superfamily N-acetyltransferase
VNALLRHGLQPITVIAVRSARPELAEPARPAELPTLFVRPGERGRGVGTALVRHVHAVLGARGVDTTLLHYEQLNPLSGPFWSRMGYRPLWTGWEVRPAASLR